MFYGKVICSYYWVCCRSEMVKLVAYLIWFAACVLCLKRLLICLPCWLLVNEKAGYSHVWVCCLCDIGQSVAYFIRFAAFVLWDSWLPS